MAQLYDLTNYRAFRLLGGVNNQTKQVRQYMADYHSSFSDVGHRLDECASALRCFNTNLQRHRATCQRTKANNEKCQQALDSGDIDELVLIRDRLTKAIRNG